MPQQVSNLQSINGLCVPKQSSACSPTTGTREPVVNHFCCLQRRGSLEGSEREIHVVGKGADSQFSDLFEWAAFPIGKPVKVCVECGRSAMHRSCGTSQREDLWKFPVSRGVTPHQGRVLAAPPHHPSVLAHPCNPTPGQFQKQIRHGSLTNEEAHRSRLVHSQEHLVAFPRVALQAQAQTKS